MRPPRLGDLRAAREPCRTARDAVPRAGGDVGRAGGAVDPTVGDLLAGLATMDELVKFADNVGQVLID